MAKSIETTIKTGEWRSDQDESKQRHALIQREDETDEQYFDRLPPPIKAIADEKTRTEYIEKMIMKDNIARTTREHLMAGWMQNFGNNVPKILKSPDIRDLPKLGKKLPVLIIGGGPSTKKLGQFKILRKYMRKFPGVIIATDKPFVPMLKNRIIPTYVTAADGNPIIANFFTDPIVDRYAKKIKALFNTTVHPNVVKAFKGQKYFYHIIFDDPSQKGEIFCERCGYRNIFEYPSLTRIFHYMTNNSLLMSMGNCGTLAWNMGIFLGAAEICMIGFDYGYRPDTPLESRSYYNLHMRKHKNDMCAEIGIIDPQQVTSYVMPEDKIEEWKARAKSEYKRQLNPDTNTEYETDFMWDNYKNIFIPWFGRAAQTFDIKTYNCTGGGALWGQGIITEDFEIWLRKWC